MKKIINYIHGNLVESMLQDDNFIPIYNGDDLIDIVYRKAEE
jgi:hypothetical protein